MELSERLQNLLVETIESENEYQFQYILNILRINTNEKLNCLNNLSIFEKVLSTPNSQKCIEMCLQKGCNFYQKNCDGIFPLYYAISSLCAKNLNTLASPSTRFNYFSREYSEVIIHTMIVNTKLEGGDNYLHFLINNLTQENSSELSEMIKTMVLNRCNPNLQNNRQETPFFLLMRKFKTINDESDLINFFINNSNVRLGQLSRDAESQFMKAKDFAFMLQLIEHWDEETFVEEFEEFKHLAQNTDSFRDECGQLFEEAVARNFVTATKLLLTQKVNVNTIRKNNRSRLAPAFSACFSGFHQVLKVLLTDSSLKFKCDVRKLNLLHQICTAKDVHLADRLKCFDLIMADPRCTNIINGLDGVGQAPLYYACFNGHDEIAKELLRRGAFIGHESIISCIDKDVLGEFLDECIKCPTNTKDRACQIHVDYRFLMPPNDHNIFHSEVNSVHAIAYNQKLRELILHPVISSFLNIKWNKINFIVYFNLLIYFVFMLFMGIFIISYFHAPIFERYYFEEGSPLGIMNKTETAISNSEANDTLYILGGKNIFDEDEIQRSTTKPQIETIETDEQFGQPTPPAVKPNLLAMIFGFTLNENSQNRKKRSTIEKPLITKNQWNAQHQTHFEQHLVEYRICFLGVILITIYEIMQCVRNYKTYFLKLSNWLDICMVVLFLSVLVRSFEYDVEDFKKVRALTILVMAAQSIQIVAKISILSMSLHMAIFKRVCATFLKTIALYLILILAFAMSFFTLNEQIDSADEKSSNGTRIAGENVNTEKVDGGKRQNFQYPFISVITTVRMMLSDFDNVEIDGEDTFEGIIFLIFVVLITVVLFNLLNALAISDTNEIMKDAELVDTRKRISILNSYEKLFAFLALSFANVFPEMTGITVKPNRGMFVSIEKEWEKSDYVRITLSDRGNDSNSIRFQEYVNKLAKRMSRKSLKLNNAVTQQILDFVNQHQRTLARFDT